MSFFSLESLRYFLFLVFIGFVAVLPWALLKFVQLSFEKDGEA